MVPWAATAWTIETVAGTGLRDSGPAVQAKLSSPRGVALDGSDNLYIADTGNHRIRRLAPRPDAAPLGEPSPD